MFFVYFVGKEEKKRGIMNLLEAIILGIVQGLTEFLPVSSSGHLALVEALLGVSNDGITFEVMVHFATLLAVMFFLRKDIIEILKSLVYFISKKPLTETNKENLYLIPYIILATIPAVIIALFFKDYITETFNNLQIIAIFFIFTGIILFLTRFTKVETNKSLNWKLALIIGLAQALAIMPGISRSGMTISIALFLGIGANKGAKFSFLLAIPVILGGTILELKDLLAMGLEGQKVYAIGMLAALISGYIALIFLMKILQKGKFAYFSFYLWLLGISVWLSQQYGLL